MAAIAGCVGLFVPTAGALAAPPGAAPCLLPLSLLSQPEALPLDQAPQALAAELARIRAAGEPTSLVEVAPPEVPDTENAAVLYQLAFDSLSLSDADGDALVALLRHAAEPEAGPPPAVPLADIVERNTGCLALLEAAAALEECRFALDWQAGLEMRLAHLAQLRQCARLTAAKAIHHSLRSEPVQALDAERAGLAIVRALADEPILVSQLVRYAIVSHLGVALRQVLYEQAPPTEDCRKLYDLLGSLAFAQPLARALWTERALWIGEAERLKAQPPEALKELDAMGNGAPVKLSERYSGEEGRLRMDADELTALRLAADAIETVGLPWPEAAEKARGFEERLRALAEEKSPVASIFPPMSRILAQRAATETEVALARTVLALKAYKNDHGDYPESLEALRQALAWDVPLDPCSGRDLRYARRDEGFLLYSLGPNLKDDGGVAAPDGQEQDILWRCVR